MNRLSGIPYEGINEESLYSLEEYRRLREAVEEIFSKSSKIMFYREGTLQLVSWLKY